MRLLYILSKFNYEFVLFPRSLEHPTSLASFLVDNRLLFQSQTSHFSNQKARGSRGNHLYVQVQRLFWLEAMLEEMVQEGVRQTWSALAFQMILPVCRTLAQVRRLGILQVELILLVRCPSLFSFFFLRSVKLKND